MKTKKPVYKFYADAGHGWLAVKRQELIDLDLINRITHYSYQRGNTVYLEEDCDLTMFIEAKKLRGYTFKLSSYGNGESVLAGSPDKEVSFVVKHTERSPIRSYDSFKPVL